MVVSLVVVSPVGAVFWINECACPSGPDHVCLSAVLCQLGKCCMSIRVNVANKLFFYNLWLNQWSDCIDDRWSWHVRKIFVEVPPACQTELWAATERVIIAKRTPVAFAFERCIDITAQVWFNQSYSVTAFNIRLHTGRHRCTQIRVQDSRQQIRVSWSTSGWSLLKVSWSSANRFAVTRAPSLNLCATHSFLKALSTSLRDMLWSM